MYQLLLLELAEVVSCCNSLFFEKISCGKAIDISMVKPYNIILSAPYC